MAHRLPKMSAFDEKKTDRFGSMKQVAFLKSKEYGYFRQLRLRLRKLPKRPFIESAAIYDKGSDPTSDAVQHVRVAS